MVMMEVRTALMKGAVMGWTIDVDREHWPPGPTWCPGKGDGLGNVRGLYFPDMERFMGYEPGTLQHADIPVYGRRWYGRKFFYRVCATCDYRENFKRKSRKERRELASEGRYSFWVRACRIVHSGVGGVRVEQVDGAFS